MNGEDPFLTLLWVLLGFGVFAGLFVYMRIESALLRKRQKQLARDIDDGKLICVDPSLGGVQGRIGAYRFKTGLGIVALSGVNDVSGDREAIARRLSQSKLPLLSLNKGCLELYAPKGFEWDAELIRKQLTEMSAIADELRNDAREERKLLLARVKSEDAPAARAAALAKLTSDYPASSEAKEAAASGANDREAEVRFAAVTASPFGPSLEEFEKIAFDDSAPALTRARSLNALLDVGRDEQRYELMSRAFEVKSFAVRHVAMLHAIGDASKNSLARALVKKHLSAFESDRDLKLQAALALGDEGAAQLEALAFEDREATDAIRAKALRGLLHISPPPERIRIARRALASDVDQVQSIAVTELSAAGEALDPLRLREIALGGREPAILAVIAALAKIHGPASEAVLIELLARPESSVTISATRALVAVGGVQSVPPLSAVIARSSDGEVVRFATIALDLIRERLGSTGGALSIAGDEPAEGALSFSDDARGSISIADKPK